MATLTLKRMAEGGINDQLGGGFCRYSVDRHWMIPHFEKIYKQRPLSRCTRPRSPPAMTSRASPETADWVRREMQSSRQLFLESRCRFRA
jgi:uncharacterized protein YyaL (SSP411 family)